MSRITTNLARISAALLLTVFLPGMALAVTANWTGGSGDYSDISNWDVANVPCNDGPVSYDVIFPDGTRTVTMDVASCNVATLFLGDNVTLVIPAGNEFTSSGQADLYGIVDDDGGGFTASVASFPGNRARAYSSSTGQVQIGAATYSSVGLTGASTTLFNSTGSGTLLDLSSVGTVDASFNDAYGGTRIHTISTTGGGAIDLSGLTSVSSPARREDELDFNINTGGTLDLSSLGTIAGVGRTRFNLADGAAVALPALTSAQRMKLVGSSSSSMSMPLLTTINDSLFNLDSGATATVNAAAPVSYSTAGHTWNSPTILSASGAGTLLDMSSVVTLDTSFHDAYGGTRFHLIAASDSGAIDLSGVTTLTPPVRVEDYVGFDVSTGGTIDLASLATILGTGGRTRIDLHDISSLSLPALQSAENLQIFADSGGTVSITGASPVSYTSTGLEWTSPTLFSATDSGTLLDLSSIETLDAGFDDAYGGTRIQTISATGGGTIDLSGLTTVISPLRSEDELNFNVNTGGTLDLSSLGAIAGAGRTEFNLQDSAAVALPSLTSSQRMRLAGSSGSSVSMPLLTTIDDGIFNLDSGATATVNAVTPVSYSTTGLTWSSSTILSAAGVGTLLDMSSVTTVDTGFNDAYGGTRFHLIAASDNGAIDLSGVTTVTSPVRQEDYVEFDLATGGTIDLSSLATILGTNGRTRIDLHDTSSLSLPALQSAENLQIFAESGGTVSINGPSPVSYSSTGFQWFSPTLFEATGAGTSLDLSSITALDAGFNDAYGGTRVQTIRATGGAAVDLSGLDSAISPVRAEDRLDFVVDTDSTLDLSSLASISGAGEVRISLASGADASVGSLRIGAAMSIDIGSGSTLQAAALLDDTETSRSSSITLNSVDASLHVTGSLSLGNEISLTANAVPGIHLRIGRNLLHTHTDETMVLLAGAIVEMDGNAPQHLEVASIDGDVLRPGADNFGIGQLVVGTPLRATTVQLVDDADNGNVGGGGEPEALYLLGLDPDSERPRGLRIHEGSTLSLGCSNVYVFESNAVGLYAELLNDRFSLPDVTRVSYDQGWIQLDTDTDSDGYPDCMDNCPRMPNPDQLDGDGDEIGNACDVTLDLDDPAIGEQIEGLGGDAESGSALSGAGDLNGDGTADFISGAPGYQADGGPVEAGAAAVYLGSTDQGQRSDPDIIFTGENTHDRAGVSVAGDFDFDGDGTPDLMIGAEQMDRTVDPALAVGNGKVYVIFFDSADYPNLGTPGTPDEINLSRVANGQTDEISGIVFTGAEFGDRAGFSMAGGGRMNAGTGQDLVIGAPGANPDGLDDAGLAYVIFDDASLHGQVVALDRVASGLGDQIEGVVYEGFAAGDELGYAVAFPGDIVGSVTDNGDDLMLGAPGFDTDFLDAGAGFFIEGGGLTREIAEVNETGTDKTTHTNSIDGSQMHGTQPGEGLGSSVAGGGDSLVNGQMDALIGAPLYDVDGFLDAGRVIHTASKLKHGIYDADQVGLREGAPGALPGAIWLGEAAGDQLGAAVAGLGDVNGDLRDDAAFGAPYADNGAIADAGAVYILHGQEPESLYFGTVYLSEGFPGTKLVGTEQDERAGTAIAGTGDVDGDGEGDLVIGAPGHDSLTLGTDTGLVYLILEVPCGTVDTDLDGLIDCEDNCPSVSNAGQEDGDGDGIGDLCDNCVSIANTGQQDGVHTNGIGDACDDPDLDGVFDDVDNCADLSNSAQNDNDGDGIGNSCDNCPSTSNRGQEDQDADSVGSECDNCPQLHNPSQGDGDNDSVGDACDENPLFTVCPGGCDHLEIQDAVDAVAESGTRILIGPREVGDPDDYAAVFVDETRGQVLHFIGDDHLDGSPVVIDGGGGSAFRLLSTAASGAITIRNLTIKGAIGIESTVSTELRDLTFEAITDTALDLSGGTHNVRRLTLETSVAKGVNLDTGADLNLSRSIFRDLSSTALHIAGSADIVNVLIAGAQEGVILESTGTLTLRHTTVAECTGVGITNFTGIISLDHVIAWGSSGGDLSGVDCVDLAWSDTSEAACAGANQNISQNPLFVGSGDYHLQSGSPTLDHGPEPTAPGNPVIDLDGPMCSGPRYRDYNGDGAAEMDIGAYEHENTALTPEPINGLRWTDSETLVWDVDPAAVSYHVYRDGIGALGFDNFGICRDDLDIDLSDLELIDSSVPDPGQAFFYVITSSSGVQEGSMGLATATERTNYNSCMGN